MYFIYIYYTLHTYVHGTLQLYVGPESSFSRCQHHPGVAIFHDGWATMIKYCLCVSDFTGAVDTS